MRLSTLAFAAFFLTACEQIIGADFSPPAETVSTNPQTGGVNPEESTYKTPEEFCSAFAAVLCTDLMAEDCWAKGDCTSTTISRCTTQLSGRTGFLNNTAASSCISRSKDIGNSLELDGSGKNSRLDACQVAFGRGSPTGGPCFSVSDCADSSGGGDIACAVSADKTYTCQQISSNSSLGEGKKCTNALCSSGLYCDALNANGPTCVPKVKQAGASCPVGQDRSGYTSCGYESSDQLFCIEGKGCQPAGSAQTACNGDDRLCGSYHFCIDNVCVQTFSITTASSPEKPEPSCQAFRDNPLLGAL